ncbi:hypothetical protein PC9H_000438 [Pleurotus ostreatus]|uniref:DUF6534 domain-containing protein n=1 Tax=Pleurotus ostreatus TaxID=5322 RepID=A0A8H7A3J5_PLEOS|nr:uncharacterized protein PC9H_000438 [Pleurotus ostreatus]KAF7440094.1 hypothetical protein PC9H_000438 [Pleurotus ostreatus]
MIPSTIAAHAMVAIVGLISQLFFAWRIFQLCRKRWLLVLTCVVRESAIIQYQYLQLNSEYEYDNCASSIPNVADTAKRSLGTVATPLWMGFSVSCDLSITLSMVILMFKALKEAIFRKTRQTLSNILRFTLETGLLTTAVIAVQIVFMLRVVNPTGDEPTGLRWRYIFFYPTGVVYSSWLLASLNARATIADDGSLVLSTISALRSTQPTPGTARPGNGMFGHVEPVVGSQ